LTPSEYLEMKDCFQGGFTHASVRKIGRVWKQVGSFDFTSSYPTTMVAEKFPMSRGEFIGNSSIEEIHRLSNDNCCMFNIEFSVLNPKYKAPDHPISASKCWGPSPSKKHWIIDNGRIVSGENITTCCTEQDLFTYEEFYDWEGEPKVTNLWIYKKGYLPTELVKAILKLYGDKTALKGVSGKEVEYLLAKGMLNSAYGMCVTDIVKEVIEYDEEKGYIGNYDNMTDKEYLEFLSSQIDKYNNNQYRFLFYAWGIWVTAYSRANLFSGILACGEDYIYSDTDSIKILNPEKHMDYIQRYNDDIIKRLELACEKHGIDKELTRPKNKFGETKQLGIWDFEGIYDEFKTLGAKRYMWRKGDKWELTVAGVNKKKGMEFLKRKAEADGKDSPFDVFNLDLVVPPEYSGRLTLTYIDEPTAGEVTDYLSNKYEFSELSSIHMESSDYSFNPTARFLEYLITAWEDRF